MMQPNRGDGLTPSIAIDAIIIYEELLRRSFRRPNFEAESLELSRLAKVMSETLAQVLRELAVAALRLCLADSAGISIAAVEEGQGVVRRYSPSVSWFNLRLSQLAAITIENARFSHQLRSIDERKDEFFARLAHELRNPFAAIGNAVKLSLRSDQKEQIDWSIEVITRLIPRRNPSTTMPR